MLLNLLPNDIVDDILLWLPVKSVSRFRCVCKSWCNLMSNPNFVKKHYNYGVEKEKFKLILLCRHKIYSSVDHYDSSNLRCYKNTIEIDYPFKSPRRGSVYIRGSCNGLLLIQTPRSIYLWNPTTTEYKVIPSPPSYYKGLALEDDLDAWSCYYHFEESAYGFGYDYEIGHYKLIRVATHYGYESADSDIRIYFGCRVQVYTLGSNSWKHIPFIFPYNISPSDSGVLVNGALHWKATPRIKGIKASKCIIVSFKFEDERLVDVSPVAEHFEDEHIISSVGDLGGCLCLFAERDSAGIEVWVMKDYGVIESWTKLLTIGRPYFVFDCYVKLIRSFKNGKILLSAIYRDNLRVNRLVLYDPEHESCKEVVTHEEAQTYVESLVSLNTGTYLVLKTPSEKNNKKKAGSRFSCLSEQEC